MVVKQQSRICAIFIRGNCDSYNLFCSVLIDRQLLLSLCLPFLFFSIRNGLETYSAISCLIAHMFSFFRLV